MSILVFFTTIDCAKCLCLALVLGSLHRLQWQISLPFHKLRLMNAYPFIYLKPEKGTLLGQHLPLIGHYREYLLLPTWSTKNYSGFLECSHKWLPTIVLPWSRLIMRAHSCKRPALVMTASSNLWGGCFQELPRLYNLYLIQFLCTY